MNLHLNVNNQIKIDLSRGRVLQALINNMSGTITASNKSGSRCKAPEH